MGIPQIILLSLAALNILLAAHLHGKPKTTLVYNFWATAVGTTINLGLLYWGGFFQF